MPGLPITHARMTRADDASRRPRACPCHQQGLRPASPDLLARTRRRAHL